MAAAEAALSRLSDEAAELVCARTLALIRNGSPRAPFEGVMAEAWLWADMASPVERRAYAWAAFHSLSPAERGRFLAAVYNETAGEAAA